jgi:hypothetical protein
VITYTLDLEQMRAFLLFGGLVVLLLAAILASGWGRG